MPTLSDVGRLDGAPHAGPRRAQVRIGRTRRGRRGPGVWEVFAVGRELIGLEFGERGCREVGPQAQDLGRCGVHRLVLAQLRVAGGKIGMPKVLHVWTASECGDRPCVSPCHEMCGSHLQPIPGGMVWIEPHGIGDQR